MSSVDDQTVVVTKWTEAKHIRPFDYRGAALNNSNNNTTTTTTTATVWCTL